MLVRNNEYVSIFLVDKGKVTEVKPNKTIDLTEQQFKTLKKMYNLSKETKEETNVKTNKKSRK